MAAPVVEASAQRPFLRRRLLPAALLVLAFLGFLISFYLTLTHYRNAIPPCYVTSGCESVITSRYAIIAGIPVSLLGTVFFGVMFYLAIALATVPQRLTVTAYWALAMAGALASIFLFLIQAFILKAYCSYCLTTEIAALFMFTGSLFLSSGGSKPEDGPKSEGEPKPKNEPPRGDQPRRTGARGAGRSARRSSRVPS